MPACKERAASTSGGSRLRKRGKIGPGSTHFELKDFYRVNLSVTSHLFNLLLLAVPHERGGRQTR